ncbi:terminal EAR1-like 1 [Euphorbia peplus]|nr:terminal EAR1-like 1 [Euphorbia peplus]
MGQTGRFPGGLDPKAEEFRPRINSTAAILPHQMPLFVPVLPPPLPPPPPVTTQLYYPYAASPVFPHNHQYPTPYVNKTPSSLPPQSAAPTRTLLLSSVPIEASESLIRRELEVYGDVRGVGMERISDGIVTVYFYDLRHAETALNEIREQHTHHQNRLRNQNLLVAAVDGTSRELNLNNNFPAPVHAAARGLIAGCTVWAQFIVPTCNGVPDGYNHGTIVVFNLDPNLSSPCLKEIFQAFGAVKELRETPLKKQQRFIEFYDIRDAARALTEMNGQEIYGRQVMIEFSRPGGFSKKFFNASTTASKSSISRFPLYYQSLPPPPPPPPPRRFYPRQPPSIPPRVFLPKPSSFGSVNPNERVRIRSSDEAANRVDCMSISGSVNRDSYANGEAEASMKVKIGDTPAKIRNTKKSSTDEGNSNTKQQHNNRNRPWKCRQGKKLDNRFLINGEAMVEANCRDSRTTVMIKNIPNKYSQKLLLNMLDNHCIECNEQIAEGCGEQPLSSYDFVYLPIDFNNKCNVGYGFVNMTSPQATLRLYKAFHHQHWEVFNSRKICEVTYARVQGLEALKEHFKNSKFPCEMDHYLPVVFSPPRDGWLVTEPQPVAGQKQQHLDNQDDDDEEEQEGDPSLNTSSSSSGGDVVVVEEVEDEFEILI